jgi:hypothetical protein
LKKELLDAESNISTESGSNEIKIGSVFSKWKDSEEKKLEKNKEESPCNNP